MYIIEGREFLCKDCSHFLNIATKINDILRIFIYYVHCMHVLCFASLNFSQIDKSVQSNCYCQVMFVEFFLAFC